MADISNLKHVVDFKNYDFESNDVPAKYDGDYAASNFFKGYFIPKARAICATRSPILPSPTMPKVLPANSLCEKSQ